MRAIPPFAIALLIPLSTGFGQKPSPLLDSLRQRAVADSNDPVAHYELALAYWDHKYWDSADSALRTAIQIAPAYADAYLALSALPQARGEKYWKGVAKQRGDTAVATAYRESLRLYRRAFLLNPMVNLKPLGKFDVSRVGNPFAPFFRDPPWLRDLDRGVNALHQGRYDEAFKRLNHAAADGADEVLTVMPEVLLWYHALAAAHVDSFDLAGRNFNELGRRALVEEERHPEWAAPLVANDYRFFLSTMRYLGGHFDEAVAGFEQALENDLSLYVAHVQLARMYEASNMPEQALTERRRALDSNPDDSSLMVELAASLMSRSGLDEAMELLARAARVNPRDPRVPLLRGMGAIHRGDPDTARAEYTRFLAIAPSSFAAQIAEARQALEDLR